MSHFSVLVIGDDVEGQLAPYQENNMGDCPEKFLEFNDQEDEYREEFETGDLEMIEMGDGGLVFPGDEVFRIPGTVGIGSHTHNAPDNLKRVRVPFKKHYATFEHFVSEWQGQKARDAKTGRYGYWENPKKKWDWYATGGRFTGMLKLKTGAHGVVGSPGLMTPRPDPGFVDQARVCDIDWQGMKEKRLADRAQWWDEYQADQRTKGTVAAVIYGVRKDDTRESFISRGEDFVSFAVVRNGKWFERGSMGWWGAVSNEKDDGVWEREFQRLVSDLPPDTLLTVVDCHI